MCVCVNKTLPSTWRPKKKRSISQHLLNGTELSIMFDNIGSAQQTVLAACGLRSCKLLI